MVSQNLEAVRAIPTTEQEASARALPVPRLGAALGRLLARWLEGPPLIPGDVDTSVLHLAARDCSAEDLLLRHGPRQS